MALLLGCSEQLILLHDPTQPSPWRVTALAGAKTHTVEVPLSPFSLRQQWIIPSLLGRLADTGGRWLYHSPYYLMPYRLNIPTALTCYDLIPLLYPRYFSPLTRLIYRLTHWLALNAAHAILAISEATKADLIHYFRIAPDQITVTPLAVDAHFRPRPSEEITAVRRKYDLPNRYVLYVGSNKPHKNLTRLVQAIGRQPSVVTLVIGGVWDPRYPQARQWVARLKLEGQVRWLGPVPESDLPALYSGATLFIFPSEYEGFGLPVLEAMACGTPVICSHTSSLPEVAGDAALLVNPLDVEELTMAIRRALEDEKLRQQMHEKGLARAATFSWERTAQITLTAYEKALAQGS
jgi:alpha-1,3-rhamnosyl/mannosyltransferase